MCKTSERASKHVRPRTPTLERNTAMRLAMTEYDRFLAALRALAPADWSRATDCPDWDVRALATHVLGMAEMSASIRENLRQTRGARRRDGLYIDALTSLQVEQRRHLCPVEIVQRFSAAAPKAARGRRRAPSIIRHRAMPVEQPVGGSTEPWSFGYLIDVILTRDTWMHRVDIGRAAERELILTPNHDGVLVSDVVAEWAHRHGRACTLTLTGPAGGSWTWGTDGPSLELDAVEYCRLLSGRGHADGLLAATVPF